MGGIIEISKVELGDESQRQAVLEYLAPREAHCLFIIANITNRFPGSHLYVAAERGRWVGVAGYYDGPRSLIPFSTYPHIARALTKHVALMHEPIEWMNGIGYAAWPAFEQLVEMGKRPDEDPHHTFMELALSGELPPWPHEEMARLMQPADAPRTALLLRQLRQSSSDGPPTERELARVMMQPQRLVIEHEGEIVATAATNGLGLRAFQVLGVASDPRYRRRGFARAVCAALIRRLQQQGARHAVLFGRADNVAALGCYRGLGFRETGDYCVAKFKIEASDGR